LLSAGDSGDVRSHADVEEYVDQGSTRDVTTDVGGRGFDVRGPSSSGTESAFQAASSEIEVPDVREMTAKSVSRTERSASERVRYARQSVEGVVAEIAVGAESDRRNVAAVGR
jgi:hypothetical protein